MLGVATIAIGEKSVLENQKCIASIRNVLETSDVDQITLDIQKIYDTLEPSYNCGALNSMQLSRLAKVNLINLIPDNWQYCIYMDSDTRLVSKDILVIYDILSSGYDLCIVPSQSQDFWHIDKSEIGYTCDKLGYMPLQLQAGVFGFAVNEETRNLFLHWSNNYLLYSNQDQAALVRAVHEIPVKTWLLGFPFNSGNGTVVKHLFGNTR